MFLVLSAAARSLTAKEIHARLLKRNRTATCATVHRALQVLLDRSLVRVAEVGTRTERDARITAILALPGRAADDRGAMRFRVADDRCDHARFAANLDKAMTGLPRSTVKSLGRDFFRMALKLRQ